MFKKIQQYARTRKQLWNLMKIIDAENIFHDKITKGKGNNQFSNFKSNVLAGQMESMWGTFILRQGRGLWTDLKYP